MMSSIFMESPDLIATAIELKDSPPHVNEQIKNEIFSQWTNRISDRLNFAESMSNPRTQWPVELDRFPIKFFRRTQKIILKVIAALFRDQRTVNQALVQTLRECLAYNNSLREQLNLLQFQHKKLEESHLRAVAHSSKDQSNQDGNQDFVGSFYAAFEDQFRGTEKEISNRLRYYLDLMTATIAHLDDALIIDIGCGRGEWLELLRNHNFKSKGLDMNPTAVKLCQEKGLDVIQTDALEFLSLLPDSSIGGLTGFHLIEHLPFESLLKLFQESARVLKPGGIVIFETPNPNNILVSAYSFYLDPTHRNPLPAPLVQFAAEYCGLKSVRTHGLHPYPDSERFTGSPLAEKFNDYFRSHQDYAVIGYRA
jgi:O-antigen chain-terminating methyltransferase